MAFDSSICYRHRSGRRTTRVADQLTSRALSRRFFTGASRSRSARRVYEVDVSLEEASDGKDEAHLKLCDLLLVLLDERVGVDNFLLLSMKLEGSSQYSGLAG